MEKTPIEISEDVLAFCSQINNKEEPFFVEVIPEKYCRENYCYENVSEVISNNGGSAVMGWVIWQRDNMYLEAEAHAIWKNEENLLVDVSPHTPTENRIIFLADDQVSYGKTRIPSKFFALTGSELVQSYIELFLRIKELEDKLRDENGIVDFSGESLQKYREMQSQAIEMNSALEQNVGRNDACPCGSGMKYKKCCGKYR